MTLNKGISRSKFVCGTAILKHVCSKTKNIVRTDKNHAKIVNILILTMLAR